MNVIDYPHSELLRVTRAYYLHWYVIEVEFNNGEVHQIDFEPLIFKAKDKSYHFSYWCFGHAQIIKTIN